MEGYCKILIADDEYIMRQGIKHLMDWEKEGFTIVGEAGNGKEALEKIEETKPHIVITDVVMPQMDGIELTKYLHIKHPEIQIIMLSGYNDFENVKNSFYYGAADYILKPTLSQKNILKTLTDIAKRIPGIELKPSSKPNASTLVSQIVTGKASVVTESQLRNLLEKDFFSILCINIKHLSDKAIVENFLEHELPELLPDYSPTFAEIPGECLIVLFNFDINLRGKIFSKIQAALSTLTNINPYSFFVLSNCFRGIENIKAVYSESIIEQSSRRFYYKNHNLILSEQVALCKEAPGFSSLKFTKLISSRKFDEALDLIQAYIQSSIMEYKVDEQNLRAITESTTYSLILSLGDLNLSSENLTYLKLNYLNRLEETVYADDFLNIFNSICDDFRLIIENYQHKATQDIINHIMDYIDHHYNESLTLTKIADKFSFSYYYLSSYFSTHCAEGFNEHLNRVRIEKSLEFLKNTDMSIAEISTAVGYSDHSYFSKVFKKFTKLTPTEYKRSHLIP